MDHNTRFMLVDILDKIGMKSIARDAIRQNDSVILKRYVNLIEKKALLLNDIESLDRLHFAGLIY